MSAGRYDSIIEVGATWRRKIEYKDENENPIPLTGYTAKMELRPYPDGEVLHTLTSVSGITITPATGILDLLITDETTATFTIGLFYYDLIITSPVGDITRLLEGTLTVRSRITT